MGNMELEIRIGNVYLDINKNTSFSFVRTNAIFDFDNLTYTRSTSFTLPRTSKNEVTLMHAGDVHASGEYMRKRKACYTVIDGVPSNGYLYINSADRDEYNCNLYIGEYVGDIFGKSISEFLTDNEKAAKIVYGDEALVEDVQAAKGKMIAVVRYYTENEPDDSGYKSITDTNAMPSWSIDLLLKRIFGQDFDCGWRIITDGSKSAQGISNDVTVVLTDTGTNSYVNAEDGEFEDVSAGKSLQGVYISAGRVIEHKKSVYNIKCSHDLYLTDIQDLMIYTGNYYITNYVVGGHNSYIGQVSTSVENINRLTNYKIVAKQNSVTSQGSVKYYPYFAGEGTNTSPILIPAGTEFRFAKLTTHKPSRPQTVGPTDVGLLEGATEMTIYAKYKIVTAESVLPTMSVADLLRLYASLKGVLIYWNGKQVVEVKGYKDGGELHDVISNSGVKRVFSNFAQRTYIAYSDDDDRRYTDAVYTVENEALTAEAVKRLPVGGGGENTNRPTATVAVIEQKYPIVGKESRERYLLRKTIPSNAAIDYLCDVSTQVKVRYRTSYKNFIMMSYNAALMYDNAKWIWLTSTWQDGMAEITLQRL